MSSYSTQCIGQQLELYLALLSCSLCSVKLHVVLLFFEQIKKEERKEDLAFCASLLIGSTSENLV